MNYRFEVFRKEKYQKNELNKAMKDQFGSLKLTSIHKAKLFNIHSSSALSLEDLNELKNQILSDPISEEIYPSDEAFPKTNGYISEILFRPGVTDNSAAGLKEALGILRKDIDFRVSAGSILHIESEKELTEKEVESLSLEYFGNNLLQQIRTYPAREYSQRRSDLFYNPTTKLSRPETNYYDLNIDIQSLEELSKEMHWALDKTELGVIKKYYNESVDMDSRRQLGLRENPTDVEIEIIAQTWSEHCKHKIFSAEIDYQESSSHEFEILGNHKVTSLFKDYVKATTNELMEEGEADYLVSVFSDNAGIVRYDKNMDVCVKVETHNSPSALDPYGGALTGILGVNRDILGTGIGAKPIANMDVFCFADKTLKQRVGLPDKILNPTRILEGVHKGVEDGGNKSGIPTINGSIHFDDSYAGKPLVYVGTVGVLPPKTEHYPDTSEKNQSPGDFIVVAGGRVGADGIHGATFSSLELDDNAPATAVQIGDPFTQKKLGDFLLKARDLGLYTSLTDNGAGGISSSIGEMAELTGGAEIYLDRVPLKYDGLANYEIMISESQERMSFSVSPDKLNDFMNLAESYEVEAAEIGKFTDTGFLHVKYKEETCAYLDIKFLHEGLPQKKLVAKFDPELNPFKSWHGKDNKAQLPGSFDELLYKILSSPNIASKENLVRNYDHEVGAASFGKAFLGKEQDGPSDAGVLDLSVHGGEENSLLAVANGKQSSFAKKDAYYSALASVDECVRNLVATGADPEKLSLLDNFCWPDPIESSTNPGGAHKLAQLVRSNYGLKEICKAYKAPLISGKDSMKNDYRGVFKNKEVKISVTPSLLITGVAPLKKENFISSDFKKAGDSIYLIGDINEDSITESEFSKIFECLNEPKLPKKKDLNKLFELYKCIHKNSKTNLFNSLHDISEGGLLCSLTESCFGGKLGAELNIPSSNNALVFNEEMGCFIASLDKDKEKLFEQEFSSFSIRKLGSTTKNYNLKFSDEVIVPLNQAEIAWKEPVHE